MIRISVKIRLVCLAVTFIAPLSAQTGTWASPVVLSTGGQGWEAAAAIDGNGNSLALWDEITTQDQLWSRSKSSTGNWGDFDIFITAEDNSRAESPSEPRLLKGSMQP
jgi:hypothetical protein